MRGSTDVLISADALAGVLGAGSRLPGGRPVRLLDVRWRLDRPDGRADHAAGHIPGAAYVDLDTQLAAHRDPTDGRHPLPGVADLQTAARSWGLDDGDAVVVYDDWNNLAAARAWWLLRHAGVADVRLLDGALAAWKATGCLMQTGDVVPKPGSITLSWGLLPTLTIEEAAALPRRGVLLDARAPERYRGEVEPIDPRAGHIPGARNTPTTANLGPDGRFLPADQLRDAFAGAGARPGVEVGTYCGSGVTAAHNVVALTLAGLSPALFPGSWSAWSNHRDLPVETGSGTQPSRGAT